MTPYIDLHSHQLTEVGSDIFRISNIIVSRDDLKPSFCSIGIHPWYLDENIQQQFDQLSLHLEDKKVIAIGECGLDKMRNFTQWDLQIDVFSRQVDLANLTRKPIIIHCVKAYDTVMRVLKDQNNIMPAVFHGFQKKNQLGHQLTKQGHYLSLGDSILRGKQDDLITNVDLRFIFFETDESTISIADIYAYFCRIRKMKLSHLKKQIVTNFQSVFNTTYF